MTSIDQQSQSSPLFDPEATPIPGQQAWAILDLHGTMIKSSVDPASGDLPPVIQDAKTLYGMLVESTPLVSDGGLKRMTINFSSIRYVVARDDSHIYLVQTKA